MEAPPQDPRKRPFGVIPLTLLLLAYAVLSAASVGDLPGAREVGLARVIGDETVLVAAHVALAATAAFAAVGLVLLHPWGWVAAMLLAGATLAVELTLYARGERAFAYMAVATLMAFYLNSKDVRRRFHADRAGVGRTAPDRVPVSR